MNSERLEAFKRNEKLELLLKELNGILGPAEDRILIDYNTPKYPVILIVGSPRSGTTLLMQWLSKSGKFAYASNLLSRFYAAPFIGAKIQQLLTSPEYNFRNEILDFKSDIGYSSDLGKTKGALAPNEFWYFWRRFIPNRDPEYVDEGNLSKMDCKKFLAEIAAIEDVFNKPLAMKGIILQYNLSFLSSIFEKVLFLYTKRHPFYNVQSILEARVKYYGNIEDWYSVKPKEYTMLKNLPPHEQVAGQIFYTNRTIEESLGQISASRWLQIDYEDFCQNPEPVFREIAGKLSEQGYEMDRTYIGPGRFESTNLVRVSEEECETIIAAYKKISGTEITK
jgi:hypothetical protein